jgi:hypothetical protein
MTPAARQPQHKDNNVIEQGYGYGYAYDYASGYEHHYG